MSSIIDVSGVSKSFGGVKANTDVTLSVKEGGITGLIGPCLLYTSPSPRDS